MATNKLSQLKSTIQKGKTEISNIRISSEDLQKNLLAAMDDEVGYSASESINSIKNKISLDLNQGYDICKNTASVLGDGHAFNFHSDDEIKKCVDPADRLFKEIEEFEKNFPRSRSN